LLYGVVEAFGSQFIGTGLQDAVALVVLLIVLIARPRGHRLLAARPGDAGA
jgi:branched-subunit amino acid ABC-type transport system permease component